MTLLIRALIGFFLSLSPCLFSIDLSSTFEISNAFRLDRFEKTNTIYLVPNEKAAIDKTKINGIKSWLIGLQGRLTFPKYHSGLNPYYPFLRNFYVKGFAYWGWGYGGDLSENLENLTFDHTNSADIKIKKMLSYDFQVGAGYLFNWKYFGLGICSGWARNREEIKPKHRNIEDVEVLSLVDNQIYGASYHTRNTWTGPWFGLDLFYYWRCWRIEGGYEYHLAHHSCNHSRRSVQPEIAYEDSSNSSHAFGNVAYLDASCEFCDGWRIGSMLRYQYWTAHCRLKPDDVSFVQLGYPSSTKVKADSTWISLSITFDIGYYF